MESSAYTFNEKKDNNEFWEKMIAWSSASKEKWMCRC